MCEQDSNLSLWLAVLTLARQATRDPLTGLYNRRFFDETLQDHIETARRYNRPMSLVIFDIDQFKRINDTYGHPAGDTALKSFADHLQSTARKSDIICRYGGDEFAVILPETGKKQARRFAERMAGWNIDSLEFPVSASAGIAALPCDHLMAEADADLLARKQSR